MLSSIGGMRVMIDWGLIGLINDWFYIVKCWRDFIIWYCRIWLFFGDE